MKKKKLNYSYLSVELFLCIVVILLTFIIQSCATTSKSENFRRNMENLAKENARCCVEKTYLGVNIILNRNNEIEFASVADDTPAAKSGILPGDVILRIDNEDVKDKYHAFILYDSKYPGDTILFTIKRKGKIITKQFQLLSQYYLNVQYTLLELVYKDIPVRLAVIFGNIDYGYPNLKEYFGKQESYYVGMIESTFLSMFRNQNNFTIIDRQKTDAILNELKFQSSGLVDNKSREKLGSMLGATHLLVTDISLSKTTDNKAESLYVMRLIEVSSGKTLSTSTFTNKIKESIDFVQLDLISYYEKMKKISVLEEEATTAYSNVTGDNYKDDTKLYDALVNVVIPKYQVFIQQLMNISPTTQEVINIHRLFVEGSNLQLQAFQMYQTALAQKDKELINKGNQTMSLGRQKMQEFKMEVKKLSK